jgi:hypothetical protein
MNEVGRVDEQEWRPRALGLLGEQLERDLEVVVGHVGGRWQPLELEDSLLLVVIDDAPGIPGQLGRHRSSPLWSRRVWLRC